MMFLNSGIGITYQTPTNQNNTILRNVLLSGAPKFLLLLGSNKSSVHYLFEFEDGEDGVYIVFATSMGPVGGQATANGLLRRCWSPDQQRQFRMHPFYPIAKRLPIFKPKIIFMGFDKYHEPAHKLTDEIKPKHVFLHP